MQTILIRFIWRLYSTCFNHITITSTCNKFDDEPENQWWIIKHDMILALVGLFNGIAKFAHFSNGIM
jgi:hypothetical protein